MSRLRIALVHPFAWPDVRRGGERYLDDLARHLTRAGHDVEVLTGTTGAASREEVYEGGGRFVLRRLHQPHSKRLERRGLGAVETFGLVVAPHLLRRRYDVVHALTPTAAIAASAARQRTVYTLLGNADAGQLGAHPIARRTVFGAMRAASEVTALSQSSAAGWAALVARSPRVLPPGVRLDRFPPRLEARQGAPRVLMSADASVTRKGVDRLLAAFARVLERHPDARLQISGAGDWSWALRDLGADRVRVAAAVDALGVGPPEAVAERYRQAAVTVLPSSGEAFGLVLLESLASGTPVVCNDDGGMPGIVSDHGVGRIADATDPGRLGTAILEAIELAARPGTAARCARHAARWDWNSQVGPAHEALYRSVARRSS